MTATNGKPKGKKTAASDTDAGPLGRGEGVTSPSEYWAKPAYKRRLAKFLRSRTHEEMHRLLKRLKRVRADLAAFAGSPRVRREMRTVMPSYSLALLDDMDRATWPLDMVIALVQSETFPDDRFKGSLDD